MKPFCSTAFQTTSPLVCLLAGSFAFFDHSIRAVPARASRLSRCARSVGGAGGFGGRLPGMLGADGVGIVTIRVRGRRYQVVTARARHAAAASQPATAKAVDLRAGLA